MSSTTQPGFFAQWMSANHIFLIVGILSFLLFLLWIPATRELLKAIFGTLLIPVFSGIFLTGFLWMMRIVRSIWTAHLIVIRNLIASRKNIHPSLQKEKEATRRK